MIRRTKNGVKIGRIEYSLDPTAIILLILVFNAFYGYTATKLSSMFAGPVAILLGVGLIISLLLHEAGHAYTAIFFRIPMLGIKLFALGGMAMMKGRSKKPSHEFLVAIAGPVVSFALALLFYLPLLLGWKNTTTELIAKLGFYNLVIAIFNLIPAFPMDGGRVFRAAMWWLFGDNIKGTKVAVIVAEVIVAAYLLFSVWAVGFSLDLIWPVIMSVFIVLAGKAELKGLIQEELDG